MIPNRTPTVITSLTPQDMRLLVNPETSLSGLKKYFEGRPPPNRRELVKIKELVARRRYGHLSREALSALLFKEDSSLL